MTSLISDIGSALRLKVSYKRPPLALPVSGDNVWKYVVTSDKARERRIRKEIDERGLSIGELRFVHSVFGVMLRLPKSITFADAQESTAKILNCGEPPDALGTSPCRENRRPDRPCLSLVKILDHELLITTEDSTSFPHRCVSTYYRHDGRDFSHRVFARITDRQGSITAEAYSPAATDLILAMARDLGINYHDPHFAHLSEKPLAEIILRSYRWKNSNSGAHYVQVTYREQHVKHRVITGSTVIHEHTDATGLKTLILADHNGYPSLMINDRTVKTRRLLRPTEPMTAAQVKFRAREIKMCCVQGCERPATQKLTAWRAVMKFADGNYDRGQTHYICDQDEHVKRIRHECPECFDRAKPYEPTSW